MPRATDSSVRPALPRIVAREGLASDRHLRKDGAHAAAHVHLRVFTVDGNHHAALVRQVEIVLVHGLPVGVGSPLQTIHEDSVAVVHTDFDVARAVSLAIHIRGGPQRPVQHVAPDLNLTDRNHDPGRAAAATAAMVHSHVLTLSLPATLCNLWLLRVVAELTARRAT